VRTLLSLLVAVAALGAGCITQPDEKSGGDGDRHKAKQLKMGKPESDAVDYNAGDRTDWKLVELQDTGTLTVEVIVDNPKSNLTVAVFDRYGKPVARMAHRKDDDSPQVKLMTEVGVGKYFVMIQAMKEGDKTGYLVKASVR